MRIVGIGACVMDTLFRLPAFPKEDTKNRASSTKAAGGGPVATGLVAAQKLGCQTAFLGNLSDDNGGVFLKADFEKYGVNTDLVRIESGYRSFQSVLWLAADSATRTCVFDKGDLPALVLDESQKKAIAEADLLMVDGNELSAAVEAAEIAREHGTKVLYDCGGLYEGVEALLALTDLMIPSEEFALAHTGKSNAKAAAKELYSRYHPSLVVITRGKEGGVLYDGAVCTPYPAFPVKVLDSNGSGDVFHGAFAAAVLRGYDPYHCCIFSSAVSAIKCTGIGARESVPNFDTVYEFLKEKGYEF